jgi:hypothetical protein
MKMLLNRDFRGLTVKCCFTETLVFWIAKRRSKQMMNAVGCEEDYT